MIEDLDEQRSVAVEITIDAGVLRRCKQHEDALFSGGKDISEAFVLGNERFSKGELESVFNFRNELTDAIKTVVADYSAKECPYCVKTPGDD